MKTPLILLAVSALFCAIGFLFPAWADLLLIGVPCLLASLWLVWRGWRAQSKTRKAKKRPVLRAVNRQGTIKSSTLKWVIVDGSNVMYWKNGEPSIELVRDVLKILSRHGYTAGVMFDANAGHLLEGKYRHEFAFGRLLNLPEDRVMVVPKGTPADPYILTSASDYDAQIVSNDQFRDWVDDYPEISQPGFLVNGGYRGGKLVLDLS